MTPEQLKQNPIMVHPNHKLDTDEGESTKDEEEFTISQELTEENFTLNYRRVKSYRNISNSYCIQQNITGFYLKTKSFCLVVT